MLPKAECISGYGNFVEIIGERNGFYRIRATMNTADFSQFDGSFNWENYPTLWVKQSSRDRFNPPNIYNVGAGLNAYFPLLQAKQNLWIHSSHVEMFPDSPEPGGFILKGMSVYTASMKLLRIATKAGVTYPTAWKCWELPRCACAWYPKSRRPASRPLRGPARPQRLKVRRKLLASLRRASCLRFP